MEVGSFYISATSPNMRLHALFDVDAGASEFGSFGYDEFLLFLLHRYAGFSDVTVNKQHGWLKNKSIVFLIHCYNML